jgi:hypothetical protein
MTRCTAPVRGHRSSAAAAECPACGSRYGRYSAGYSGGYSSYGSYSSPSYSSSASGHGRSGSGGSGRRTTKPRWSRSGSSVWYTPEEVRSLTPVRENIESLAAARPELRDAFSATLGMTGKGPRRNFTICSKHVVSGSGSARKTLASVCH